MEILGHQPDELRRLLDLREEVLRVVGTRADLAGVATDAANMDHRVGK
jgi:hypothetical protein